MEPAKCMIAPIFCSARMPSTNARSATDPSKNGTSAGTTLTRPVRQIVDDRDAPPGVLEREHRVAADIAGAAGDEDWDFAHA